MTHSEHVQSVDELFGVLAVANDAAATARTQRDEALRQLNDLARRHNRLVAAVDRHKRTVMLLADPDLQHEADLDLWKVLADPDGNR
jgi:hypothetical protein